MKRSFTIHSFQYAFKGPKISGKRGSLLLLVLIFMIVLGGVVSAYLFTVLSMDRAGSGQVNNAQAFYLAEAGLHKAIWYLRNTAPDNSTDGSWRTASRTETLGTIGDYTMTVEDDGNDVLITSTATFPVIQGVTRTVHQKMSKINGLVGWWKFDEAASPAADSSINNNDGTWKGGPTAIAGASNNALIFSGAQYVSFSEIPTRAVDNWTISAWLKPAEAQLGFAVAVGKDNGNGDSASGYSLGVSNGADGSGSNLVGLFSGVQWLDGGYTFPAMNQWYHVVMMRDSGVTKFYVNGLETTPATYTDVPRRPTAFRIGSQEGIRYFKGGIDDVRIYERALTDDEVFALSHRGLLAWWKFDDGVGTTAADATGHGHTATAADPEVSPTWDTGLIGTGAASFSGGGDYFDLASTSLPAGGSARTITAWIKPNVVSGGIIGFNVGGSGCTRNFLNLVDSYDSVEIQTDTCAHIFDAEVGGATRVGTNWSFIGLTYDGSAAGKQHLTAYRNMDLETDVSAWVLDTGTGNVHIGRGYYENVPDDPGAYRFNGLIDDLRIYDRALSGRAMKALYYLDAADAGKSGFPVVPLSWGEEN